MYVTAHHVSNRRGEEAINAAMYLHGQENWQISPTGVPDPEPGELLRSHIALTPGGNHVRSYLDLVAPDGAQWPELHQAFIGFLAAAQPTTLPWVGISGRCLFRFGLELALAKDWPRELARLYRAAEVLHRG